VKTKASYILLVPPRRGTPGNVFVGLPFHVGDDVLESVALTSLVVNEPGPVTKSWTFLEMFLQFVDQVFDQRLGRVGFQHLGSSLRANVATGHNARPF